jgi:hypothetical protein
MDYNTFIANARGFYESRIAIELVGAPGTAKSSAILEAAAHLSRVYGEPFGVVAEIVSTMTEQDLRGYLLPTKRDDKLVAAFSAPPFFPTPANTIVFENGVRQVRGTAVPARGIVLFDEFGQAEAPLQKAASPWVLDRGLGEHHLPDGWVVWAASNRQSDRAGVVRRLSILQNRMLKLDWEMPVEQWISYASRAGVHPLTISFVHTHGPGLFASEVPATPEPFCTYRSLTMADRVLRSMAADKVQFPTLGDQELPTTPAASMAVSGLVGGAAGVKFMAHLKYGAELAPLADVVSNPSGARVPKEYLHTIQASVLAQGATRQNVAQIMKYLMRSEFGNDARTVFVYHVEARAPELMATSAISRWVSENPRYKSAFLRS